MQERRNSIANALELHLSCTNPWIFIHKTNISGIKSHTFFKNEILSAVPIQKDTNKNLAISHC